MKTQFTQLEEELKAKGAVSLIPTYIEGKLVYIDYILHGQCKTLVVADLLGT